MRRRRCFVRLQQAAVGATQNANETLIKGFEREDVFKERGGNSTQFERGRTRKLPPKLRTSQLLCGSSQLRDNPDTFHGRNWTVPLERQRAILVRALPAFTSPLGLKAGTKSTI